MIDPDVEAASDADVFKEVAARLAIADEAEGPNRQNAIEALNFVNGDQWPSDISSARRIDQRPALTVNHTDTLVNRVINNIKEQRPRITVHPVSEGADMQTSQVIGGLIRHIENRSKASIAYDKAAEFAVKIGWGFIRILSEFIDEKSFDQELKIVQVPNAFSVYTDPMSTEPDASDAMWFIITGKMKRQEFHRLNPDEPFSQFTGAGTGDETPDWENKEEIRLAEYYRISEKSEWLYKLGNGNTVLESDLPEGVSLKLTPQLFAHDQLGNVVRRKSARREVQWFRINGTKVVDKRILPGRYIPVVRCLGNRTDINGRVILFGMIKNMMDPARMFNYWRSAETETIALAPKSPWVVAEGQIEGHDEWHQANTRPFSTLVYKPVTGPNNEPVPPPQRQPAPQIPAAFVNAAAGAEHDLMAVSGMPHEPSQDKAGEVISGIALRRRQALSDISHFQYYDNQTLGIAQVGRVLLEYLPYYYDTYRMQRIIGEDGVPETVAINQPPDPNDPVQKIKNDLTIGRYAVVMDTGPGYQTKMQESTEVMLALMGTQMGEVITKVGADVVMRNIDVTGAQQIADRLAIKTPDGLESVVKQLPKQAQDVVKALAAELQQAQGAIQSLQMEIKYKTQTEMMWAHVEREKNQMNAEVKVHDTEIRGHTARDVAEIQAGATLLNTHAEADHNKEAAKLLQSSAAKAETEH